MDGVKEKIKDFRIAFVSTYPPIECGIATFTNSLVEAISNLYELPISGNRNLEVIALSNSERLYNYGPEVSFEIRIKNKRDYLLAADYLNLSKVDIVSIQHEFGIYGGPDGEWILLLIKNLKKPVIATLHTILTKPTRNQKRILKEICKVSKEVIVLADKGFELLQRIYGVPISKIKKIHHGVPDIPFVEDTLHYKKEFHLEGKFVILTYGLISPNKGIELVIEALSQVVKEYPNVVYLVLGETHPNVRISSGEKYREFLNNIIEEKKLEENVIFHNRFVPFKELNKYLMMADLYITPYISEEQISSGTLSYAVASGRAVISTPYWHAQELLGDGRGFIVPFGNARAMAEAIKELIRNERKRNELRRKAYEYGRNFIWPKVASSYLESFVRESERIKPVILEKKEQVREEGLFLKTEDLPKLNLDYLKVLTDDTGIFQHSKYSIPDRRYGYTTDDNARAAIVALKVWSVFKYDFILPMLTKYLSFLADAYDHSKGKVRVFLSFDRRWKDLDTSEDCHGRLIWTFGTVINNPPTEEMGHLAVELFHNCLNRVSQFSSPRAWAFSVLGITKYLEKFPNESEIKDLGYTLANRILNMFKENSSSDWIWLEDIVSYENARFPQVLLEAGRIFKNEEMKDWGLKTLKWLIEVQTDEKTGFLSLIGNKGWFKRNEGRAKFDQQPVEIPAIIDACYEAYLSTGDKYFLNRAFWAFKWFLGENIIGESLYKPETGGCKDGLTPDGVNKNEGSESLVCWLLSLLKMYEILTKRE
ncbi:MAG: glycosyltransferase family 4 protein [candidate division WOR-3 bacterium]